MSLLYDDAGFGDTLMVGAVAREIKKKYGDVSITVNRVKEDLLKGNPHVSAMGDRYNGIDLNYHYGSYSIGRSFAGNILDSMCRKVGVTKPCHSVDLYLTREELDDAKALLDNVSRPIVSIQTTAGEFGGGRKLWPQDYWTALVELLADQGITVIHLGGVEETIVPKTISMIGKQDIRRSMAFVAQVDLHVGVVSSLMHAAEALNTQAIILYGGFERYKNHGYSHITPVESSYSCAPCATAHEKISPCSQNNACMREIKPQQIADLVTKTLNEMGQ